MARQEFLSGGFIGKMGQLVGQHWHNKRYVRTYVKPHNPQTPDQQQNRSTFTTATRLAQEAFNINKGDPSWDTSNKSEFSLRVGTAMNRLLAGMTEEQALPLYPDSVPLTLEASIQSVDRTGGTDTIQLNNLVGDDSGAAFGLIELYNASANEQEEFNNMAEYNYNQSLKQLTGQSLFSDKEGTLCSVIGAFRNSSHTIIPGSSIHMGQDIPYLVYWYNHADGAVFSNEITLEILPDNLTVRAHIPPDTLPAGDYHGYYEVAIDTSSGDVTWGNDTTSLQYQGDTVGYMDFQAPSALTNPDRGSILLEIVPNIGTKAGFALYGSETF